jgi:hypothetical protein
MKRRGLIALIAGLLIAACNASAAPQFGPLQPDSNAAVLFKDDFSDPNSGWRRETGDKEVIDYLDGAYRISDLHSFALRRVPANQSFGDVRIEVDGARLGQLTHSDLGVICRYTSGDNYYYLMINDRGEGRIGLYQNGHQHKLLDDQASSAIKLGNEINHLRADCVGRTLTLYANGVKVASVDDASLDYGDVGLITSAGQDGGDVLFDNFIVYQP